MPRGGGGPPYNGPREGERFGRLVVTELRLVPRPDGRRRRVCVCRCDCGEVREVTPTNLKTGNTTSCGCWHVEVVRAVMTTHGDTSSSGKRTRLYRIWKGMRARCTDPEAANYRWYGARGIGISSHWDDYAAFRGWALNNGYADHLELDRVDSNGNYTPANCRWLSKSENVRRSRQRDG